MKEVFVIEIIHSFNYTTQQQHGRICETPRSDCEHDGNVKAHIHVQELKELFKTIGMDPDRIQIVQVKHGDKAGFQAAAKAFMEKINELGPLENQ